MRIFSIFFLFFIPLFSADLKTANEQIDALASLTAPPAVRDAAGKTEKVSSGEFKTIYFDALKYKGKPTRVFAWVGLPDEASSTKKVPGVVLVHGGGGTAFKDWVKKWNDRGYAAMSIGVEGQTDQRPSKTDRSAGIFWEPHQWPGPRRKGIYGDSNRPIKEQWMYHAVADTILANSLLRSLPQVDSEKVGLMGISWGGVITSTVIGIDSRFAFAIPTYGCGDLSQAANQYGRALGNNEIYKKVWDPILRIRNVKMPVMWFSWPGDQHFPLNKQASCYKSAPGQRTVCLIPGMKHGHGAGWNPPDSYAFADSVVKTGMPWAKQVSSLYKSDRFSVVFKLTRKPDKALLIWTSDKGVTGSRKWQQKGCDLKKLNGSWEASVTVPADATAWFVNLKCGILTISSDYFEKNN